MDMEDISAGKNTGNIGFQTLIHQRAVGHRVHCHTQVARKFVFGNESAGKEQGVAGDFLLGAGDGFGMFIHLGDGNALHPFLSFNIHHSMAKFQRNPEVIQTLYNISL